MDLLIISVLFLLMIVLPVSLVIYLISKAIRNKKMKRIYNEAAWELDDLEEELKKHKESNQ